ncbi:MAG TPA: nitronate monooxygenase [Opitutaceae bacterium]|nr:nitronate monooxygenase [Opitutaceae bacterium]
MEHIAQEPRKLPLIIQGGMGAGVSNWNLARAVAGCGQLGVVSGTALNTIFLRRLQTGDADGSMRRALAHYPRPAAAEGILKRYFIPGGLAPAQRYRLAPVFSQTPPHDLSELTIAANFAEIFLAKEGHAGPVGLNLLEKIQLPTLASLFGAMLAGVDYVLMGAGIPRAIPGMLDRLAAWQKVELKLAVEGVAAGREHVVGFDPAAFFPEPRPALARPAFLAIVSSATLAMTLARKSNGRVDGFVVEGLSAGGHNAPPRGGMRLDEQGEPIYGPRDQPDLDTIRGLGLPFWLAGSYASPGRLREALAAGATGVQIGTAFAFCEESGMQAELKQAVIRRSQAGTVELRTDPRASPTGMPFKVVSLDGTVSAPEVYQQRKRICDLGYLRQPYERPDGTVGYRCPAEPVDTFVSKGGKVEDAVGRKCLCNGLLATIGLGQTTEDGGHEPPIVTAGEDAAEVARFLAPGKTSYSAADVLTLTLG